MSRRAQQQQRRAERSAEFTRDEIYGLVFAETSAWQEAVWGTCHDESLFAAEITDAIYGVARTDLTAAGREYVISEAVRTHMQTVAG